MNRPLQRSDALSESRVQKNACAGLGQHCGSYPRPEMFRTAARKSHSDLAVVLHSWLAAPANLVGEESFYIAWSVGRALDPEGSGRILVTHFLDALCIAFSRKRR